MHTRGQKNPIIKIEPGSSTALRRSFPVSTLFSSALKRYIHIYIDPWRALNEVLKKANKKDLILISGSFYLAGELRKKWVSEDRILKANS